jgi:ceramide glucosyltransferase
MRGGDRLTPASLFLLVLLLSVAVYAAGAASLAAARRGRGGAKLPGFFPPVSIVKPLSGMDDELERNLESFYRLEYSPYEVIYSFARRGDPAFSVARRVADRHPEIPSIFVIDAREPGGNSKVSRLTAALRHARYRHVLMADGNVRVHREFLARAISFFSDRSVGLVSHLFRARGARTLGSRLESLHSNGALRAGTAALAGILRMPCVVGKSILVSREALNAIGGIEALRDHLAEDYLLGKLIAGAGYRVVLSGDEIETAEVSRSLSAAWSRQRRWAILRKRLGGPSYAAELLASPLPWFAGVLLAARNEPGLVACAAALYLLRIGLEALTAARSGGFSAADWALAPLRDLAAAALFWAGLFGRRTSWRGRALRVGRDTLIEQSPERAGRLAGVAHQAAEQG